MEKNQKNEVASHVKDLEARRAALKADLEASREREGTILRERNELSTQLAEMEKQKANLQCELEAQYSRNEQLASQKATRLISQETLPSLEHVRNLESKLDQEKLQRQRSDTQVRPEQGYKRDVIDSQLSYHQAQEKVRELSMLTVDNRQLQYRLDKLEADYRQESEKVS